MYNQEDNGNFGNFGKFFMKQPRPSAIIKGHLNIKYAPSQHAVFPERVMKQQLKEVWLESVTLGGQAP